MTMAIRLWTCGLVLVATSIARADRGPVMPDPDLWGNVTNLNGDLLVPILMYDPASGVLSIDTLGVDGVSSTTGNNLGGDDIGLLALSLDAPPFTDAYLDGFSNGMVWTSQFFNGKVQLFGTGAGSNFLEPGCYDLFQFEPNLTPTDFGAAELAAWAGAGDPGPLLIGGVQFVPEPSSLAVLLTALLGVYSLLRRK